MNGKIVPARCHCSNWLTSYAVKINSPMSVSALFAPFILEVIKNKPR